MDRKLIVLALAFLTSCSTPGKSNDQPVTIDQKATQKPVSAKKKTIKNKTPKKTAITQEKNLVKSRSVVAPFKVGESLNLTVWYGGLKAGRINMKVLDDANISGKPSFHFQSQIQTTSSIINGIFKIDLTTDSFVDKKSFSSLRYRNSGQEGKLRKDNIEEYNLLKKTRRIHYRETKDGRTKEDIRDFEGLPDFSQDILSAIYYARTIDFSKQSKVEIPVVNKEKISSASLSLIGEENLKINSTNVSCWVLALKIDPTKDDEQKIWISKDDRKIYQLSIKSKLGKLLAKLEN